MQSLYEYLRRFKIGNTTFFLTVAALVGLLSGMGNIVFVEVVEHSRSLFFDVIGNSLFHIQQGDWHRFLIILLPVTGALLLIPLAKIFPGLVNGYGFPKFLSEVHLKMARISPLRLIANTTRRPHRTNRWNDWFGCGKMAETLCQTQTGLSGMRGGGCHCGNL